MLPLNFVAVSVKTMVRYELALDSLVYEVSLGGCPFTLEQLSSDVGVKVCFPLGMLLSSC